MLRCGNLSRKESKSKLWIFLEPSTLIQPITTKKAASEIDEQLQSELENVELEYEDWEKTKNAQRKVVLEHNYKVNKTNARNRARSAKFTVEWNYMEYANEFRKSAKGEIERLLDIEDTEKN